MSTAAAEVRGDHGCGRDLLGTGRPASAPGPTRAPAARAASTSAPMSPITTHSCGSHAERRRRGAAPGRARLAAGAAVVGGVRADLPGVERPEQRVDPRVHRRRPARAVSRPRADAGLVGDHARPACPRPAAGRAPRRAPATGATGAGSPLYGTSCTSVPSRSKSTARGGGRPRAGRAVPPPPASPVPHRGERDRGAGRSIMVTTSAAVRGPGAIRAGGRSPRVAGQPGRRRRQRRRPAVRRAAASGAAAPAATRPRPRRRRAGGSGRARRPAPVAPVAAVQPAHQRVVGVAALHPHAGPGPTGRTGCSDLRAAGAQAPAGAAAPAAPGRRPPGRRGGSARRSRRPDQRRRAGRPCPRWPSGPAARPAVTRSQSVGRRSGRQRHLEPPLRRRRLGRGSRGQVGASGGGPARRAARRRRRGTRPTVVAVPASRGCGLPPGRGPHPCTHPQREGPRRVLRQSSGGSASRPVVDHDDLRRRRAVLRGKRRPAAVAGSAGRGSGPPRRTAVGVRLTSAPRRRGRLGAPGAARAPGRRPAPSRTAPGRPGGRRPSAGPRCSGWC